MRSPTEWRQLQRIKVAMSDIEQGGSAVLMHGIERAKVFTISEWQTGVAGLSAEHLETMYKLLVDAVLRIVNPFVDDSSSLGFMTVTHQISFLTLPNIVVDSGPQHPVYCVYRYGCFECIIVLGSLYRDLDNF